MADDYESVRNEMAVFCVKYIDIRETPRNHEKLVKRLIEIIRDDFTISHKEMFKVDCMGDALYKAELMNVTKVNLPIFLLSVWAFVVLHRTDNTIGRETVMAWSDAKAKGRYNGYDGTSIKQDISIDVPVLNHAIADTESSDLPSLQEESAQDAACDMLNPKRITVNNYGTVQNQKFLSIEVNHGDIHL
jgi:hypothetical protein